MQGTIVETRYGKVQGVKEGTVYAWKGVPYAKPPVGALRFMAPQPPEPWTGIRDASEFGPNAIQFIHQPNQKFMSQRFSEDCLYLNIWSPAADNRRRPVLVWIHGGFFRFGGSSIDYYNGASFAEKGDVVLVSINYRLGALGFLQLRDFGEQYADAGNCGLLDQVAALKWVKENISAFGGDPDRVTIFGQSAGGRSVSALLAMPAAQGLFQRAIIHSGAASNYSDVESASAFARDYLQKVNIGVKDAAKLQEIPVEKLVEASPPPRAGSGTEPHIDGLHLPRKPLEALAQGMNRDVRIMVGYMLNDFIETLDPAWKTMSDEQIRADFADRIGPDFDQLVDYYLEQGADEPSMVKKLLPMLLYNEFAFPARQLLSIIEKQGNPGWLFRFDWLNPLTGYATHGLELPFVFNNLHLEGMESVVGGGEERQPLADFMQQTWAAFARNGDPNVEATGSWAPYTRDRRDMMLFNTESRVVTDLNPEERLLWERVRGAAVSGK